MPEAHRARGEVRTGVFVVVVFVVVGLSSRSRDHGGAGTTVGVPRG